jgi:hypothetical protein
MRRPRRYCPGVQGEICPICCGTQREVTVDCPLDCSYLIEARLREKPPEVDPRNFPNADIHVTEDFLRRNEALLILAAAAFAQSAVATHGAIDSDVRESLDSLVRTYRASQSGLYYENQPANILAAQIQRDVQQRVADLRKRAADAGASIRDADILGVMAFLQRLEIQHNNGRPKGRAFIHFLQQFFPQPGSEGGLVSMA